MLTTTASPTTPGRVLRRSLLLFAAFLTMGLCSAPARSATSCPFGETLELINPVVTVIEGPKDDATEEQKRWSMLAAPYIEGMQDLHFEGQRFELERAE
ncbi:hypothetical protein [Enhygromyxa salina]|uniref:hypothetical protein n=1 Tax=Enhygromyxa salina TaxID=215803 RepID=UPI0011BAC47B|nr:hypothetical protein [Enhygromyxa salina]